MVRELDGDKFVEEVERAVARLSDGAGGLIPFGFGNAGQAKLAAIAKGEPDLHHQDGTKAPQTPGSSTEPNSGGPVVLDS
jgi:hypothetical protein